MKKNTVRIIRKSTQNIAHELIVVGTTLKITSGANPVTQERYNQECKTIAKLLKEFPNQYDVVVVR